MSRTCDACGKFGPVDSAHVKSRGAGGSDEPQNLLDLCRDCHRLQHAKGWAYMWRSFERLRRTLVSKGWEIREVLGIEKLVRIGAS